MRIRTLIAALTGLVIGAGISLGALAKRDAQLQTAMARATYVHENGKWPVIPLPPCEDGEVLFRCKQI